MTQKHKKSKYGDVILEGDAPERLNMTPAFAQSLAKYYIAEARRLRATAGLSGQSELFKTAADMTKPNEAQA